MVPLYYKEISDLYHSELGMKEAKGGEVIPLVVLAREMRGGKDWTVPEKQVFLDLIVHIHSITVRDAAVAARNKDGSDLSSWLTKRKWLYFISAERRKNGGGENV